MLEHKNIAHQIRLLPDLVGIGPGDTWVSILPSWHTFEQTLELCSFSVGCVTVYTDKRRLRDDLRNHRPEFFASVPRIWETIYAAASSAIRKRGTLLQRIFQACLDVQLSANPIKSGALYKGIAQQRSVIRANRHVSNPN